MKNSLANLSSAALASLVDNICEKNLNANLYKYKELRRVAMQTYRGLLDLHPNNIHLYVANWFDNIVSVIDISSLEVITEIQVGEGCRAYGEFISR